MPWDAPRALLLVTAALLAAGCATPQEAEQADGPSAEPAPPPPSPSPVAAQDDAPAIPRQEPTPPPAPSPEQAPPPPSVPSYADQARPALAQLHASATRFVAVSEGVRSGARSPEDGAQALREEEAKLAAELDRVAALAPPPEHADAHGRLLAAFDRALAAIPPALDCLDYNVFACRDAIALQDEAIAEAQAFGDLVPEARSAG